jgi:Cof subfamily protein (haloacid dehalogenase superfamily)
MLKMVVTDIDGTLLNSDAKVDDSALETLNALKELNVVRVLATGRSPYSISKVIPDDFPVDYIIFSSGAGIIHWGSKQIIHSRILGEADVQTVVKELINHKVDFMVHEPIPHNHCFLYHSSNEDNPDFYRRIDVYRAYCRPYIPGIDFPNGATQIISVLPMDTELFAYLSDKFPQLKVIRTTSPLDGKSIWMEIFPIDVSKAYGISWLLNNEVKFSNEEVISIGNDFNDLDMLEFTKLSYVVANSPDELKSKYNVVPSNDEHGFSVAVNEAISTL